PPLPAQISRFPAFDLPPPPPSTRIRAGADSVSSSSIARCFSDSSSKVIIEFSSEKIDKKLFHACHRQPLRFPVRLRPLPVEEEAGRHRPLGPGNDVDQAPDPGC